MLLMLANGCVSQKYFMSSDPESRCRSICWKNISPGDNEDGAKSCLGSCIRFISDALALHSGGIDASSDPISSANKEDVADSDGDADASPSGGPERLSSRQDASLILDRLLKRGNFVRIGKRGEFEQGPLRRSLSMPGMRQGAPFFGEDFHRDVRLNSNDKFEQRKFSHFVRIGRAKGAFIRIGKGKRKETPTEDATFLRMACEGRLDANGDNSISNSCHGND